MSGQKYVVRQGDCLASIAAHHGLPPHWNFIYDAPDNQDFRKKPPNPNLILPGDDLIIPELKDKTVSVAAGQSHTFQVTLPRTRLVLKLFDDIGAKPTKADYELQIRGVPEPIKGSLAGGVLDTPIPAKARKGHIIIRSTETGKVLEELDLRLGGLGRTPYKVRPRGQALSFLDTFRRPMRE